MEQSHAKMIFKDVLAGSIAGIALTLTGHPFDFLKVRMQTSTKKMGVVSCFRNVVRNEGAFAVYKGMSSPITTVPLVNAVVFSSYEICKRAMGVKDEKEFSIKQSIIAGMFAGLVNSFVVGPIELIKCRLQVQTSGLKKAYYHGSIDCLKRTIKDEGLKGPFKGMFATVVREVPCYAAQFSGFYYSECLFAKYYDCTIDDLGVVQLLISGSMGGLACWLVSYPQDVIKTILQVDHGQKEATHYKRHRFIPDGGFINCFKSVWKNDGWYGLWKGFTPCAIRALSANATLFLVYELAKGHLQNY